MRPPAAQLLYDLGLEPDTHEEPPTIPNAPSCAAWPPSPPYALEKWNPPPRCLHAPLPLCISDDLVSFGARAVRVKSPAMSKKDIVVEVVREFLIGHDDMAMVYLSPNPFYGAFKEELDLRKFDLSHHGTAGLNFLEQDSHLYLASMEPGTPGARISWWCT
jgi:hypothetical protein